MFQHARKEGDAWCLSNDFGHELRLPGLGAHRGAIDLGTLGTRTRGQVRGRKTDLMADLLAAQRRPVYLIDTRRNGSGAQSSWSPREFGSVIADRLAGKGIRYAFLHLPALTPSIALLDRAAPWQEFRSCYEEELSEEDCDLGCAFVEAATACDGLAIFLCAEEFQPDFDRLPAGEQEGCYCHRFTLVRRIAGRLRTHHGPDLPIRRLDLDLSDFQGDGRAFTATGI